MGSIFSKGWSCSLMNFIAPERSDDKVDQPKGNASTELETQDGTEDDVFMTPSVVLSDEIWDSVVLSEDIWERVAMCMATPQWVQVSGTCKALSRVQLPHIDMGADSPDAMVWVARHSHTTKTLSVGLHDWDDEKSRVVSAAVKPGDWHLGRLETLCVTVEPRDDRGSRGDWLASLVSQGADHDAHRWMTDMLSSAYKADNMGAAFARLNYPPVPRLAHLGMGTPPSPVLCFKPWHEPALRYLRISMGPRLPDMQKLPTFNTAFCSALYDVVSEYVLPCVLTVSPEVDFNLGWRQAPIGRASWEDVHDRCTRLVSKKGSSMMAPLAFLWQLDRMSMSPCPALRVLSLMSISIGSAEQPLKIDLPCLEHLSLGANNAHVLLSESTCPRRAHFGVTHEMDVIVEDKAAFAARIDLMGYIGCETISRSTQLLLNSFNDPLMWRKTCETHQHLKQQFKIYKVSRK